MAEQQDWGQFTTGGGGAVHSQARGRDAAAVVYGGCWRRLGGQVLDGILYPLLLTAVFASIGVVSLAIILAVEPDIWRDRETRLTLDAAQNADLVVTIIVAVLLIGILAVTWWFYFPAAMSIKGGTLGMRIAGLHIVSTEGLHNVKVGQAFSRFFFAWLMGAVAAVPLRLLLISSSISDWWEWWGSSGSDYFVSSERPREAIPTLSSSSATILIAAALFSLTPVAWYFLSPRRQTAYDAVAGTLVIRT